KTKEVDRKTGENARIVVQFPDRSDPIGDSASILNRYIGDVARDSRMLPITASDWRLVDKTAKDAFFSRYIEPRFYIDPAETKRGKKYIYSKMGEVWARNRRLNFDKYYSASKSLDENLSNVPPGFSEAQWGAFVKMRTEDDKKV
ncbi:hypothetical protein LINGRAHAP2_LOCUS6490, partial [Linum grandiflorum]